ncbi:MAG: hypothetical protein KDI06_16585 [Calditrichaeota bacterium]|nr:hypothetical protein [Calditrichota bacterium]HQU72363.1 hypothetical protein [Calditrichia bacterium]
MKKPLNVDSATAGEKKSVTEFSGGPRKVEAIQQQSAGGTIIPDGQM